MAIQNMINVTDFTGILEYANQQTQGYFWFGMMIMFFLVVLVGTIRFDIEISGLISSFTTFIVSLLLSYAGLMAWTLCLPFFAIIVLIIIHTGWGGRS